MKNIGYIRVIDENVPNVKVGGHTYAGSRLQKVHVEGRFNYLGHSFIIHRKESGYVVTLESIGFLVSEPRGKNEKGSKVKNPTQHATPEKAQQYAITRINSFMADGKDFHQLVKKHLAIYGQILPKTYLELKNLKII